MNLRLYLICIGILTFLKASAIADADSVVDGHPALIESALILPDTEIRTQASIPPDASIMTLEKSEEQKWWWHHVKNRTLNLNDTSVRYPKFLKFCLDVYRWGDHFFNSFDPEYVVGTGKRWKARIVNDNWVDTYIMTLPGNLHVNMLSNLYPNLGGYVQYMAVSVGYSIDMGKYVGLNPLHHKKWEFGFNCARFNAEIYYHENTGGTYLRRFGKYENGRFIKEDFPGLQLYNFGIEAMYFLNNKRYSHGAAYNFSKIQKRSQGSWIVGFTYSNVKLSFDFSQLPDHLMPFLTIPAQYYLFHYKSYAALIGYGFNWVIKPRLLYNVSVMPSFGIGHCYEDSLEGKGSMFAMNLASRMSLTYNLGNWFFCLSGKINGHWYKSNTYSLFSSVENFAANIGFRF